MFFKRFFTRNANKIFLSLLKSEQLHNKIFSPKTRTKKNHLCQSLTADHQSIFTPEAGLTPHQIVTNLYTDPSESRDRKSLNCQVDQLLFETLFNGWMESFHE